jgi:hypothetical protein
MNETEAIFRNAHRRNSGGEFGSDAARHPFGAARRPYHL